MPLRVLPYGEAQFRIPHTLSCMYGQFATCYQLAISFISATPWIEQPILLLNVRTVIGKQYYLRNCNKIVTSFGGTPEISAKSLHGLHICNSTFVHRFSITQTFNTVFAQIRGPDLVSLIMSMACSTAIGQQLHLLSSFFLPLLTHAYT